MATTPCVEDSLPALKDRQPLNTYASHFLKLHPLAQDSMRSIVMC